MSDLRKAAESGRRETLVALRDLLAARIEDCASTRDLAPLAKRLMDVMDEIDEADDRGTASPIAAMRAKYAGGRRNPR